MTPRAIVAAEPPPAAITSSGPLSSRPWGQLARISFESADQPSSPRKPSQWKSFTAAAPPLAGYTSSSEVALSAGGSDSTTATEAPSGATLAKVPGPSVRASLPFRFAISTLLLSEFELLIQVTTGAGRADAAPACTAIPTSNAADASTAPSLTSRPLAAVPIGLITRYAPVVDVGAMLAGLSIAGLQEPGGASASWS
jgi:hypothetical protein